MSSNRMHRGLVGLSASAIAAIYIVGYLRTQPADASLGAAATPTASAVLVAMQASSAAPARAVTVTGTQRPPTPTVVVPSSTTQQAYKDGTYTGQGSSRRGGVTVSVVVQGGHIASATITGSTLQYPLRDIARLPDEVVQRQSAQVDIVSRATYSSQAFRDAVSQALSKAV